MKWTRFMTEGTTNRQINLRKKSAKSPIYI